MIGAWLFVPELCARLVHLLANWVVLRFTQLFFVVGVALVPAFGVALLLAALARLEDVAAVSGRRYVVWGRGALALARASRRRWRIRTTTAASVRLGRKKRSGARR